MKTTILTIIALLGIPTLAVRADDNAIAAATAALSKNQLETAEALVLPLTTAERPDPRAWHCLSQIRARQKRTKEAIELAEKAVQADAQRAEFHSQLGAVLGQRTGEVNVMQQAMLSGRMLSAFRKSIEIDPEHVAGYVGLARYYSNVPAIAGGSREKAEGYAREVEKRHPVLGIGELARVAEKFDDLERAYALWTKVAEAQSDNATVQERLGRLAEKRGQAAAARAHYEHALRVDPARESARTALAALSQPKN